jgi:hypothetical protein
MVSLNSGMVIAGFIQNIIIKLMKLIVIAQMKLFHQQKQYMILLIAKLKIMIHQVQIMVENLKYSMLKHLQNLLKFQVSTLITMVKQDFGVEVNGNIHPMKLQTKSMMIQ